MYIYYKFRSFNNFPPYIRAFHRALLCTCVHKILFCGSYTVLLNGPCKLYERSGWNGERNFFRRDSFSRRKMGFCLKVRTNRSVQYTRAIAQSITYYVKLKQIASLSVKTREDMKRRLLHIYTHIRKKIFYNYKIFVDIYDLYI